LTFQRWTLNDDGEPLTLETCKANPLTVPVPGSRYINSSLAAFTQVRAEDVALRLLAITGNIRNAGPLRARPRSLTRAGWLHHSIKCAEVMFERLTRQDPIAPRYTSAPAAILQGSSIYRKFFAGCLSASGA